MDGLEIILQSFVLEYALLMLDSMQMIALIYVFLLAHQTLIIMVKIFKMEI